MSRLADYFLVIGFDHEKERNGLSSGKVLQRFPAQDWDDTPFIEGIELFCQPLGWGLSLTHQQPTFFISVLTDIDANRHYCSCLSFNEPVAITPTKVSDDEAEEPLEYSPNMIQHHSIMYAPKCLVLVSRLQYFDAFKNCLGILYTVYIDTLAVQMETLVGNILGCVQVPPPGGPQVRYSIGAGDRQALQPPLSASLSVTNISVYQLFSQLGIYNAVTLFCAAMTEHKILFHSKSYSRLTGASHALTSLMFPFKYSHVYIPLLPASLIEVLSTPTPFIMGVHSDLQYEITDLLDVVVVDLDGGALSIPESINIPMPVPAVQAQLMDHLCQVLRPDLMVADDAFPTSVPRTSTPLMLDKEIRAIFLLMFAQILQGYRSCLTITRINPRPHITFHKAAFLGHRNFTDSDFMVKLLDCMFFNTFVAERGPPYRVYDIFDEWYANITETLKTESKSPNLVLEHIRDLSNQLQINENPNPQTYVQKIPKPTDGAFTRIHQPVFPTLNGEMVQEIIEDGLAKSSFKSRLTSLKPPQARIVPMGPPLPSKLDNRISNSARRLEVLRNCVNCIFENKISDARKIFPAVVRALKSHSARIVLTQELATKVTGNKAMLEHQQFDLIVRLLNCALQDDSSADGYGLAASVLPLAMAFCRKLCTGVIQFAYTCIQDHPVWTNQQFWEASFYQDVQKDIHALYQGSLRDGLARKSFIKPTALEIAAEQMRLWPTLSTERQQQLISNEESTVFSQAIHYANRMVALRVPLESHIHRDNESISNVTNSIAETDSLDAESGFEEDITELGTTVIKFVSRFVDKVCTESGVTEEHIKALHQMIPGVVAMQLETLDAVHRESKRLPPIMKPKILLPVMLQGEQLLTAGLRSYLVPDGRDDGMSLLPAEGALFLTNYRLIFKGTPCDPFAYVQTVVRSFPIVTLTREKRINVQYLHQVDQFLQEGLQLRSSTFQLMKVAFDEEVTSEDIEGLRKLINRVHAPSTVFHFFAFSGHLAIPPTPLHKDKEKNSTLKVIAKKTLLKTAMRAGFKTKHSSRKHKYIIQGDTRTLPSRMSGTLTPDHLDRSSLHDDLLGSRDDTLPFASMDFKTMERLSEKSYIKDYARLQLNGNNNKSKTPGFRISAVNTQYSVCRSYPSMVVVPQNISDDSLRKLSKCYRHYRFPAITWRHSRTQALLLRASSFHVKGVIGMFKGHPSTSSHGTSSESSAQLEQEKLIAAIASATIKPPSSLHDSTLSITSLVLGPPGLDNFPTMTPDLARRPNPFHKAVSTFRNSGGKAGKQLKWGSLKERHGGSIHSLDLRNAEFELDVHTLPRVALYIFGEKAQVKNIKSDNFPNCDFIPVDFFEVRAVKTSFKKLLRACVPSNSAENDDQSFYKTMENCEWFSQLQSIMQLSGAVVDLLDVQGSSVMVCLEDGWDFATQVVSIAQLCLDPYYRTFEGFRVLIEKEWLAFGHRFSHRANHLANLASGFAPLFLQFLDVVHQIHHQFSLSFEFNLYYLKFLAYHYVSCRFRTFLLDSECERAEAGWLGEERRRGLDMGSDDDLSKSSSLMGPSFWDYVDRLWARSPIFYNVHYVANLEDYVLRPYTQQSVLRVWEYYLEEELAHGPSYDLEVVAQERQHEEEMEAADGKQWRTRRVIHTDFDCMPNVQPHAFSQLLETIQNLQVELGHLPQKWNVVWDKADLPTTLSRQVSFNTQQVRLHGRNLHKRATIEILVRGKIAGETSTQVYSHPHKFEKYNFTSLCYCDYCSNLLWNPVRTGLKCSECFYNCHEKCMEQVPKNCTKFRNSGPDAASSSTTMENASVSSTGASALQSQYYDQFSSNVAENRTHEGYLSKRGALLKGWKQRWFVLDSIKHQLRYYDAMEDSHCKGFIDLAEVISVTPVQTMLGTVGPIKKIDDKCSFDLKTIRRTYNFMAADAQAAQEWIEKLQACLQ